MGELSYVKQNYIRYIDSIVKNNKISHAYLIEVGNYEEDLSYVYTFIKMILCGLTYEELLKSDNKIINLVDTGNYPDISIVSSDTSVINKSLITGLQKEFSNKSLLDGKRIYIIQEAEKLNASSANTILKFLEEPEEDIVAFLITNNRYHIIETILSRCQILSLKEEHFNVNVDDNFSDFLDAVVHPNNFFMRYNSYIKDLFSEKAVFKEKLMEVENVILSYLSSEEGIFEEDISFILDRVEKKELIRVVSIIEDELPKLDFNVNYKLWIDSFFSKLIGG